jgi:tetratricopeptide (TPR) repeat protein
MDPSLSFNEPGVLNNSYYDYSLKECIFFEGCEKREKDEANNLNNSPPKTIIDSNELSEWYYIKGYEARKKNEIKLAIDLYTKAIEYNPNNFNVY